MNTTTRPVPVAAIVEKRPTVFEVRLLEVQRPPVCHVPAVIAATFKRPKT